MSNLRLIRLVIALCALAAGLSGFGNAVTPPGTVVMSNLENPRHLAFGPEGGLYVAEAGHGGDGPCIFIRGENQCAGSSGRSQCSGVESTSVSSRACLPMHRTAAPGDRTSRGLAPRARQRVRHRRSRRGRRSDRLPGNHGRWLRPHRCFQAEWRLAVPRRPRRLRGGAQPRFEPGPGKQSLWDPRWSGRSVGRGLRR